MCRKASIIFTRALKKEKIPINLFFSSGIWTIVRVGTLFVRHCTYSYVKYALCDVVRRSPYVISTFYRNRTVNEPKLLYLRMYVDDTRLHYTWFKVARGFFLCAKEKKDGSRKSILADDSLYVLLICTVSIVIRPLPIRRIIKAIERIIAYLYRRPFTRFEVFELDYNGAVNKLVQIIRKQ